MTGEHYGLGLLVLAAIGGALLFGAGALRRRVLGELSGAAAVVADTVAVLATLLAVEHVLGVVGALTGWAVGLACLAAGLGTWWRCRRPGAARTTAASTGGRLDVRAALVVAPAALVAVDWTARSVDTFSRGTAGVFDTLWYHLPFAARFVQEGNIGGLHHTVADPLVAFYPADSSLLHAAGMLLMGSDALSPLMNLLWLFVAYASALAIGRASGSSWLPLGLTALVFALPLLRGTQPGEGKDDAMVLALVLAALALLWSTPGRKAGLAYAGAAVGIAAATKLNGLPFAVVFTAGVGLLAARGQRALSLAWWGVPLVLTGVWWYLRNLVEAGSPLPAPSLPWWDRPESVYLDGPLGTALAKYTTDLGVWQETLFPALARQLTSAWPVILALAAAGVLAGLRRGGPARLAAAAAVVSSLTFAITPSTGGGLPGQPVFFEFQLRHAAPALLLALIAGAAAVHWRPRWLDVAGGALAVLTAIALLAPTPILGRPGVENLLWVVAVGGAVAAVAVLLVADRWRPIFLVAFALAVLAGLRVAGGPGGYLSGSAAEVRAFSARGHAQHRPVYTWAQPQRDRRIGYVGTFVNYHLYGRDLSNRVRYVGRGLARGDFDGYPDCRSFRAAVRAAGFDFVVVTADGRGRPMRELAWLDGAPGARRVAGGETAQVFAVGPELEPAGC